MTDGLTPSVFFSLSVLLYLVPVKILVELFFHGVRHGGINGQDRRVRHPRNEAHRKFRITVQLLRGKGEEHIAAHVNIRAVRIAADRNGRYPLIGKNRGIA